MSTSNKAKLDKLKAVWYKRLKDEGFEDIEQDENSLKVWSSYKFGKSKGLVQNGGWQAKAEYYHLATQFANEYKFNTKLDEIIWVYHADGLSIYKIVDLLKDVNIKTNRQVVWLTVKRLRTIMKDLYIYNPVTDIKEES